MKRFVQQVLGLWLAVFAALATAPAQSQTSSFMSDIDIYATTNSATAKPNVLLVVDNTGNWSSLFTKEMAAISQVIAAIPANSIRLGVMMFTESGNPNTGTDGGYIRSAMRDLTPEYKTRLQALFSPTGLDSNRDQSNAGKAAWAMAEAYYYFAGKAPVTGNTKAKTDRADYATVNPINATTFKASTDIYSLGSNALPNFNSTRYNTFPQDACSGNFIIFISNGPTQDPSSDNDAASLALTQAYGGLSASRPTDITGLTPSGSQVNVADEWARFMRRTAPEAVQTFTVDISPKTTNAGLGWSALLASMAGNSNGEYIAVNTTNDEADAGTKIANALGSVFNQILAKDGTFASASLPVSANARGAYLNQVFMGMFRPDASAKPRWRGNLKQYRFGYNPLTDTLSLQDSAGNEAINAATGFLKTDAVSYWTSASTFFTNEPMGTPTSTSDSPDGDVVEKGGAAQRLRSVYATSQDSRRVYTCLTDNCADLTASTSSFSTGNTALGTGLFGLANDTAGTTERNNIINWVRGANNVANDSLDRGPGGTVTVRPSVHGDVLHSRPAVVNFGPDTTSTSANNVVVFYGSNDGTLRAINGNQTESFKGVGAGEEFWSFVPPEVMTKFRRLRNNTPEVKLFTTTATGTTPRDYLVDGPIGLYQKINSAGNSDRAVIYAGLRRGGRAIYAIDVTNIAAPQMLWKKTGNDLSKLGETWSEPRVARLKGYVDANQVPKPVVIMGGGYDSANEDPFTPTSSSLVGNVIYVFDALSGEKLREFDLIQVIGTARSVPADVSLVDADYDGFVDRAYAADVHGNVYRIDFEVAKTCSPASATCGMTKDDWKLRAVASLSDKTSTPNVIRKVFFAPDVVLGNGFAGIMVGTGDREKPLCGRGSTDSPNCPATADGFYTIFDTLGARPADTDTITLVTPSVLGAVNTDQSKVKGCVIPMNTGGEKVINAPLTVGGFTYFSTNRPDTAQVCKGNLGTAKVYGAKVFCQGFIAEQRNLGGMPPSAVSGVVTVQYRDPVSGENRTKQVPFVIGGVADPNAAAPNTTGADSGCGLAGCRPKLTVQPTRTRKYWFVENPR